VLGFGPHQRQRVSQGASRRLWVHHGRIVYPQGYNFGRIYTTLRVTPAMEAGVADHVWSLEKIAQLAS
jgi:hypothetical protein